MTNVSGADPALVNQASEGCLDPLGFGQGEREALLATIKALTLERDEAVKDLSDWQFAVTKLADPADAERAMRDRCEAAAGRPLGVSLTLGRDAPPCPNCMGAGMIYESTKTHAIMRRCATCGGTGRQEMNNESD